MKPKDLLVHLEKGDRTMEILKASDSAAERGFYHGLGDDLAMLNGLASYQQSSLRQQSPSQFPGGIPW